MSLDVNNSTVVNANGGGVDPSQTPTSVPPVNGGQDLTGNPTTDVQNPEEGGQPNTPISKENLQTGDVVSIGDVDYTIDEEGNLRDKDNNIFKQSSEVKEYLNSLQEVNVNEELNIANVQSIVGVTIENENGEQVQFANTPDGVAAYINSVIELKNKEAQDSVLNKYFATNPMIKQFADYVQVTGSPQGFGDIPDRSNIKLDKDNDEQLMSVIRMAAKEFNNPTIDTTYLNYLKANGSLYEVAKSQLKALVDKDKAYMANIQQAAEEQRLEHQRNQQLLHDKVEGIIKSGKIQNYQIPERITKEVGGKMMTFDSSDFLKYVTKTVATDENGNQMTGYQRDINKLSDDEILHKDLLDAWLMFTNGSYKDLVDMAIKEENVRKLKLRAKEAPATKPAIVIKPKTNNNTFVLKSY